MHSLNITFETDRWKEAVEGMIIGLSRLFAGNFGMFPSDTDGYKPAKPQSAILGILHKVGSEDPRAVHERADSVHLKLPLFAQQDQRLRRSRCGRNQSGSRMLAASLRRRSHLCRKSRHQIGR